MGKAWALRSSRNEQGWPPARRGAELSAPVRGTVGRERCPRRYGDVYFRRHRRHGRHNIEPTLPYAERSRCDDRVTREEGSKLDTVASGSDAEPDSSLSRNLRVIGGEQRPTVQPMVASTTDPIMILGSRPRESQPSPTLASAWLTRQHYPNWSSLLQAPLPSLALDLTC